MTFPALSPDTARYAGWDLTALLAEFVLVRGDLDDPDSRETLLTAILLSAEVEDLVEAARVDGALAWAKGLSDHCRAEAAKPDPTATDPDTPSFWRGYNAALLRIAETQQTFAAPPAREPAA